MDTRERALGYVCRICEAPPGVLCSTKGPGLVREDLHVARWDAAIADHARAVRDIADHARRDLPAGKAERDKALAQVTTNADATYRSRFEEVVVNIVRQRLSFTSEDITAVVGMPPGSPNAVGALTRGLAVKAGYVKVGRAKAHRVGRHAGEIAVWGPA